MEPEDVWGIWFDFPGRGNGSKRGSFGSRAAALSAFPDSFPRRTTLAWALACIAVAAVLPLSSQEASHALPVHPDLDVTALQGFDGFVAKGPAGVQGKVGVSVAMADVNGDGLRWVCFRDPRLLFKVCGAQGV